MSKFPHHRLFAYRASLDLAQVVNRLVARLPRRHHKLADHLTRSSEAMPLLIAEGANRVSAGHKHLRFSEAKGECGEVAASLELADRLELLAGADLACAHDLADRVSAMLSGLIRKFS